MPVIPTQEHQTIFPSAPGTPYQNPTTPKFGEGLSRGLAAFGENYLDQQNEAAVNDLYSNQFSPALRQTVSDFHAKQGKEAMATLDKTVDQVQNLRKTYQDQLQNPAQRKLFDDIARRRTEYALDGLFTHASTEQQAYAKDSHLDFLKNQLSEADAHVGDPERWQQDIQAGKLEIGLFGQQTGEPDDSIKARQREYEQDAYGNRVLSMSNTDPQLAKKQLETDRDLISPKDVSSLETHIDALINRNQAHGEKAYNAALTQVSSGVPFSPQAWAKLGSQVSPDQLQDVQAQQQEVQDTLRKPVQQQVDYLKDRKTSILNEGGTEKDWQHLSTLTTAISNNQKQIDKEPLQYGSDRLGIPTTPIAAQMIGDDSAHDAVVDEFTRRASTLDAVRKSAGVRPTNQGLLTTQEAANFTNTLNQIRPEAQVRLLTRLYGQIGDPQRFRDTVQQVAPGNDPLYGAALIAANPTAKVTSSRENSYTGEQAAETIAIGRRILNPVKTDKAEDGPGGSKFELPPDYNNLATGMTGMRNAFDNATGNAFAGNPQAAEFAYQTFKAAYAGLAVKDGDYSSADASKVANRQIEAAALAFGNKLSNKAGGVDTFPPWGMDEAQFLQIARTKLAGLVGERLPSNTLQALDNGTLGFQMAGFNKYALVSNGQFLTSPDKSSLILDFNNKGALAPSPKEGRISFDKQSSTQRYDDPKLNSYADEVGQRLGLPTHLLNALKNAGEKSNPLDVSPAGAKGVMQFMPDTAKQYGLSDATDPLASIEKGGVFVSDLLKLYNGNVKAAIAHYNGGTAAGKAVAAGKMPPKKETRDYVDRVMSFLGKQT